MTHDEIDAGAAGSEADGPTRRSVLGRAALIGTVLLTLPVLAACDGDDAADNAADAVEDAADSAADAADDAADAARDAAN